MPITSTINLFKVMLMPSLANQPEGYLTSATSSSSLVAIARLAAANGAVVASIDKRLQERAFNQRTLNFSRAGILSAHPTGPYGCRRDTVIGAISADSPEGREVWGFAYSFST
jgi:hypothetical protein